jgi:hypothetical protein
MTLEEYIHMIVSDAGDKLSYDEHDNVVSGGLAAKLLESFSGVGFTKEQRLRHIRKVLRGKASALHVQLNSFVPEPDVWWSVISVDLCPGEIACPTHDPMATRPLESPASRCLVCITCRVAPFTFTSTVLLLSFHGKTCDLSSYIPARAMHSSAPLASAPSRLASSMHMHHPLSVHLRHIACRALHGS